MTLIQIILTVGILVIGGYAYKKLHSSYMDAVFIFIIVLTGLTFILFPGVSNKVAHLIGVGRGADMVFYLVILFFGFLILKLYSKIRKMEQILTEMVRDRSLQEARFKEKSIDD
jgi:hypothetical protein